MMIFDTCTLNQTVNK